jgi:hypothetical protein
MERSHSSAREGAGRSWRACTGKQRGGEATVAMLEGGTLERGPGVGSSASEQRGAADRQPPWLGAERREGRRVSDWCAASRGAEWREAQRPTAKGVRWGSATMAEGER